MLKIEPIGAIHFKLANGTEIALDVEKLTHDTGISTRFTPRILKPKDDKVYDIVPLLTTPIPEEMYHNAFSRKIELPSGLECITFTYVDEFVQAASIVPIQYGVVACVIYPNMDDKSLWVEMDAHAVVLDVPVSDMSTMDEPTIQFAPLSTGITATPIVDLPTDSVIHVRPVVYNLTLNQKIGSGEITLIVVRDTAIENKRAATSVDALIETGFTRRQEDGLKLH